MAVYPADYPIPIRVRPRPEDAADGKRRLAVLASKGEADTDVSVDVVYRGLRPVWFAMQVAGFYPMHHLCRGWGWSPAWLAVGAVQYGAVLALAYLSVAAAGARVADFDGVVIQYLVYIQCALPVAALPLYALHRGAIAEYLSQWRLLQAEFARESGRELAGVRGTAARASRESWEMLAVVAMWVAVVGCAVAPLEPPLAVAALAHSALVSALLAASWYLHGRLLRRAAHALADHLARVLARPSPSPSAVDACRLLVLRLTSLAGALGRGLTLPMGLLLLLHFVMQTLTLYALFGQVSYATRNALRVPFLVAGALFSGLVLYLCCDTGHRVARAGKDGVLREILAFRKRTPLVGEDLHNMVETFVTSLQEVPSEVSLSGITTIDRQLFTAILSTMVTYLVVIVQFRVSLEAKEEDARAPAGTAMTSAGTAALPTASTSAAAYPA